MNKLLQKLAKIFIGLSMAAGVGVAVATSKKIDVNSVSAGTVKDTITSSDLAATGTSYTNFSDVTKTSDAVYAGNSAKDNSGNIQMRSKNSNSGIVSTTSGGTVASVEITVASGSNTIDVYGSNSAYSAASDLYGDSKGTKVGSVTSTGAINFTGDNANFEYVGIRSNNGAIYLSSIEITWNEAGKTLSSITLGGTYDTEFTVGDTFNHAGMTVTANYSDSTTATVTSSATWSSPDMSTSGTKQVTVSYTENGTTKSASYNITVNSAGTTYTVTNSVSNATLSSSASVAENDPLNITIIPGSHWVLPTSLTSVTMGGNTLTAGSGYTYNSSTGAFSIASVTGNVVITGACTAEPSYSVTYVAGDHGTGNDYVVSNQYAGSYTLATFATAGFSAASGYAFKKWSVGGVEYAEGASITISGATTVTAVYQEVTTYTIVTSVANLVEDTTFVLVYETSGSYYVDTAITSNHVALTAKTAATTISNGVSSGSTLVSTEAMVLTLKGSEGAWKIKCGDQYLKFTGSSNGNDAFDTEANASTFSASMSGSYILFTCTSSTGNGRVWRMNTGSKDMRNYATSSGVGDVYMFANIPVSNDTTTALSISACSDEHYSSQNSTWTGYDTYTLDISSFTISCTTTKSTPAEGYSFKGIGYMDGDNFVARLANFSSGHPIAADTRLCWQAKYPTTAGGSTYLNLYVILSVTADSVTSLAITGSMTKTSYTQNEAWDPTGFTVNAYYASASSTPVDVTSDDDLSWSYSPQTTASLDTKSVTCTASYGGRTAVSSAQTVTVSAAPTTITITGAGSSGTTQWKPTSSGDTFLDSSGNTATLTTDVPTAGWSGTGTPYQIGANDKDGVVKHGTYVIISIPLSNRSGVTAASVRYCSNGGSTVNSLVYGDDENDIILNTSVTGNTATEYSTTDVDVNYSTINASTIHFKFTFTVGCKIGYVSYTLGSTVQEFQTFTSLAIQTETTDKQFKEGDTFSASGLVLRATDNVGFTKDFTSGFKFGTSEGDDSYSSASLNTSGEYTIYVTLTIGGITKSVNYDIVVTEVPTYSLVSDYSTLYEGSKVLIVSGTNAASVYGSTYLTSTTVTFTGDDITDSGDALEFTIRIYGNKIIFQHGEYYLSYSGSNNQIQRTTTLSDSCAFYNDGTGLVSNVEGRYLEYCSSLNPSGFACVTSAYGSHVSLYISDKAPKTSTLGAETFAYKYLHMRDYTEGDGSCMNDSANHYYSTAKAFYTSASFSSDEKVEFAKITDAVARLQAWARANGETFDPSAKTFSENPRVSLLNVMGENTNSVAIIVIISMVSVTAIGGYFFLRKRKEEN